MDDSFKAAGAKSGPETWMMQAYYELMKTCGKDFPALLPQVYLYYDPLTQAERGYKLFEHANYSTNTDIAMAAHTSLGEDFDYSQYPHFVFDTAKVLGTEKKEIIEEELEGELPF